MCRAIDLYEDLVGVEGVAVASVLALQASSINSSEFDAPVANGFAGYSDASLGQEILDIAVAEIEAIVEPDGVTNDIGWEAVTLVLIREPSLSISAD